MAWQLLLTLAVKMPFTNSSNRGLSSRGQLANKIKVSRSFARESIKKCPNKAVIQNANISSLFSMWNSHWWKWKYHVCRKCKRCLQHGSRERILPVVLWNLNHLYSSRTSGCGIKKNNLHILCEKHTIHHFKAFWIEIRLFFNCQPEEVKKCNRFCTENKSEVYQLKLG